MCGGPSHVEAGRPTAIGDTDARSFGAPTEPVVDAGSVSRAAVVGDVHGNAVAFAAVLDELAQDPPDIVVVNGDLSWGPEPEATFALAGGLANAVFVRGNAESALMRRTADSDTASWMLEHHSADRLEHIEAFAGAVTVDVDGLGRVFACHGSPRGDQEIVTPGTPDERMAALLEGRSLDVLVTAHVHLQFERRVRGVTSMNAGSVGLQYGGTPAAYWAEIGPGPEVRLRRTEYDLDEAVARTHASGIPTAERIVDLLRNPPPTEEIVEHAERLEVSD